MKRLDISLSIFQYRFILFLIVKVIKDNISPIKW